MRHLHRLHILLKQLHARQPHPPRTSPNGTVIAPAPPRAGMPSAVMGRQVARSIADMLAAHWVKHLLHYVFIYKAKARPGWAFLPE